MSRGGLTISLTLVSLYRTLWAMSRKNRSKFIAFPLNNSQICKAAFVQYDESAARQISAHQPQPATTATAWTAQHLPHPRPAGGQRETQPPPADAIPQPVRQQSQRRPGDAGEREDRGKREGREERPENDSKRAPPSLHPRQSHRPGAPPMPPAVPAYKARGQPRRAPEDRGSNSAFVEYAELPLTNAAHAIPGEARQGGYFTF